jgi:hypothetical protein
MIISVGSVALASVVADPTRQYQEMTVNRKQKQYTNETIARARRVGADAEAMRASVDAMHDVPSDASAAPWATYHTPAGVAAGLYTLYESLGDHQIAVANTLGAMGIRGVVLGERCCPLANLGRMATGLWTHVASGRYAIVDRQSDPLWYRLPQACAQMMLQFDCGDYPWLEREPQGDEGAVQLASQDGAHVA